MAGDADFAPMVEEVKRLGKRVHVSFFREDSEMSPKRALAADFVNRNLPLSHVERWKSCNEWEHTIASKTTLGGLPG
jgi:hypothetical protein